MLVYFVVPSVPSLDVCFALGEALRPPPRLQRHEICTTPAMEIVI